MLKGVQFVHEVLKAAALHMALTGVIGEGEGAQAALQVLQPQAGAVGEHLGVSLRVAPAKEGLVVGDALEGGLDAVGDVSPGGVVVGGPGAIELLAKIVQVLAPLVEAAV